MNQPTKPKYPEIEVQLSDEDGNAFAILGRVIQALKRGGVNKSEREDYIAEAMNEDYKGLLLTSSKWVTCL